MGIYKQKLSRKSTLYDDIYGLILEAGWQDISSNKVFTGTNGLNDGNVLFSPGINGQHDLKFQMTRYTYSDTYNIQSSQYTSISIFLRGNYFPNSKSGVNGTFDRAVSANNTCIAGLHINSSTISVGSIFTIWYDIDLDHISIVVEDNVNLLGYWMYVGLSNQAMKEDKRSELIFCSSSSASVNSTIRTMSGISDFSVPDNNNTYYQEHVKNISINNKYIISEIAYGNDAYGIRGVLPDIYVVLEKLLLHGDTFTTDDGRSYRFTTSSSSGYVGTNGSTGSSSTNSFPTSTAYFCFRIT